MLLLWTSDIWRQLHSWSLLLFAFDCFALRSARRDTQTTGRHITSFPCWCRRSRRQRISSINNLGGRGHSRALVPPTREHSTPKGVHEPNAPVSRGRGCVGLLLVCGETVGGVTVGAVTDQTLWWEVVLGLGTLGGPPSWYHRNPAAWWQNERCG